MNKTLKKVLFIFVAIVLVVVIAFSAFLLFSLITMYRPSAVTELTTEGSASGNSLTVGSEYSAMTFNIGYCGLDKTQDFFMDGGTRARAGSKNEVENNLSAITSFLKTSSVDFMLLQEIDVKSARSYKVNQLEKLKTVLSGYETAFSINYKVGYVPLPLSQPMGSVLSGIVTMSAYQSSSVQRHSFDGQIGGIYGIFELQRCFSVNRIPVSNGKELVLINAHFSAYDSDGTVRKAQLEQMKKVLDDEYKKGNYVVLGADFNHQIPGTTYTKFSSAPVPDWVQDMPVDILPDNFSFVADPDVPTCRNNDAPFNAQTTFQIVIDGFIVSDNVQIVEVKGQQLNFENSDHNPVKIVFKLI